MLNANSKLKDYKNLYNLVKIIDNSHEKGKEIGKRVFDLVFKGARQNILKDAFKNKEHIKMTIQNEIIRRALETESAEQIEKLKTKVSIF